MKNIAFAHNIRLLLSSRLILRRPPHHLDRRRRREQRLLGAWTGRPTADNTTIGGRTAQPAVEKERSKADRT